jgi:hypothetical protein
MSELAGMSDLHRREVRKLEEKLSLNADQLAYVPLVGRSDIGVVVLRRSDLGIVAAIILPLHF